MKSWMLLRHAKSDWNDASLHDKDRPLNARGRKATQLLGEKLIEKDYLPDRILCSSAVRTQETLKGLLRVWAQHCDGPLPEVLYFDALYLAAPNTIFGHLQEHAGDSQRIMTIGHNPGIEQLASELLGIPIEMKTAHLLIVQQEGNSRWNLLENFRGED